MTHSQLIQLYTTYSGFPEQQLYPSLFKNCFFNYSVFIVNLLKTEFLGTNNIYLFLQVKQSTYITTDHLIITIKYLHIHRYILKQVTKPAYFEKQKSYLMLYQPKCGLKYLRICFSPLQTDYENSCPHIFLHFREESSCSCLSFDFLFLLKP